MSHYLFYVEVSCTDQKREQEFNYWYDTIHIPDVMNASPDFLSCRRYKLVAPGDQPSYLVVIDIESDDINHTMEIHRKNSERIKAEGRWSDLVYVVSRKLYKLEEYL